MSTAKQLCLAALCGCVFLSPILGQTSQKVAAINKKVIGRWFAAARKEYIEFFPDGSCVDATLSAGGTWQMERDKLEAWEQGNDFRCGSGALTLVAPNVFTRDYGMGGTPERFYREAQNVSRPEVPSTSAPPRVARKHAEVRFGDPRICRRPDLLPYNARGVTMPHFEFGGPPTPQNSLLSAHGFHGSVPVCYVIDETGMPQDIRLVQSPGEEFDKEIIRQISQWRYTPAIKGNVPVRVIVEAEVTFK